MKKTLLLAFLIGMSSSSVLAQDGIDQYDDPNDRLVTIQPKFSDNFFVELHAGSYLSWGTNLKYSAFFKRFRPAGGVAVGKWLNPYIAPRLQFMWGMNKGQLLGPKRDYGFHSVAATGDAVISLSNSLFRYNPRRWIDVQLIAGVGAEYTFGFTDEKWNVNNFYFNDANKLHLSLHAGAGLKFRVSEAVDLGIESVVTFSGNTFDGGYRGKGYDGHVNIMATFGYRFLNSTGSHRMTFRGRRYMSSYHHARPKIRKISTEYISIVATDDRNRIQSTAYFAPDSSALDPVAKEVVREAVEEFREHNSSVKIYLTVKDETPENLPLFLLRAGSIKQEMMNTYVVPGGIIYIERNPEVVKTLDPEKVAVVVYIDDKPGTKSSSPTEAYKTQAQSWQIENKAQQVQEKQRSHAVKQSHKERIKAERQAMKAEKEAAKAQEKALKAQERLAKKNKKSNKE